MIEMLVWMVIGGALCLVSAQYYIHMLQLESYQLPGYFRWMRQHPRTLVEGVVLAAFLWAVWAALWLVLKDIAQWVALGLYLVMGLSFYLKHMQAAAKAKKPLGYTKRVKRLMVCVLILSWVLSVGLWLLTPVWTQVLLYALVPFIVAAATLVMAPVEKSVNNWFFRDAQRILRERPELVRIGITGSFGKTSVKFILGTILKEKYRVLVPPSSFNTPMGLTRVVREQLKAEHEVFIAEMGARHKGDIAELCRLVSPTYGLISSVGKQHLETFKTLDAIKRTKYELIDALPDDGEAFFPDDGGICLEFYHNTKKKGHLVRVEGGEDCYARASDIEVGPFGSRFMLRLGDEVQKVETKLLGRHNISNILLCAACAHRLGLTMAEIAAGIKAVEPVEHRLQLLPTPSGVIVIDDAFNANPAGTRAAMDVLKLFEKKRIVVTPGLVELGKDEESENEAFGAYMASAASAVILVGEKRTQPIRQGLLKAGFDEGNIHVVASLKEAQPLIGRLAGPGDVVLFENDLPDNY